ncbi:hypothetical protein [Pseudofulvibacter geojedonensis]|uniref:Uncharacterized protein n=1 Tax=Pseudofulvibacter geojedonensis TaxID=1123758 RepID=A0ABW3I2N0_9FLAO
MSIIKKGIVVCSLAAFVFTPIQNFATTSTPTLFKITKDREIKITIDKDTRDSEFKEITNTLKKHDIEASFSKIKRNKQGEITGIKIELEDNKGNASSTSISSSEPINAITLGAKNDSLYITSENSNNFSFNGKHSLSKHFDFSFDDEKDEMIINGKKYHFDEIKKKMKDAFVFEEDENGKRMILKLNDFDFDFDFDQDNGDVDENVWIEKKTTQKFRFIDDPEIEKYIVIDGKKADFKRLDELAKANKLNKVDFLKPETAMSVYGKKAKDGAIIATTKK